jgi:hypothetical protein
LDRNLWFESSSLQRRVNKLSVPLEMTLVEGSIRRARTDWPSGGIARGNAHPHYFTYDGPPATRRDPKVSPMPGRVPANQRLGRHASCISLVAEQIHQRRRQDGLVHHLLHRAGFHAESGVGDRGWLSDLDAPIVSFFPEYADLRTPRKVGLPCVICWR